MSGIAITVVLLACACLLASVLVWARSSPYTDTRQTERIERRANLCGMLGVALLMLAVVVDYESAPVVYYSNKAMLQTGKKVCAFVDTTDGKKPCAAFSKDQLRNMEEAWSD